MKVRIASKFREISKAVNQAFLSLIFKIEETNLANVLRKSRHILTARVRVAIAEDRGDVPGWVLVVLMTTGLVTAIWAVAAPRLSSILRNSLDSMNHVR